MCHRPAAAAANNATIPSNIRIRPGCSPLCITGNNIAPPILQSGEGLDSLPSLPRVSDFEFLFEQSGFKLDRVTENANGSA